MKEVMVWWVCELCAFCVTAFFRDNFLSLPHSTNSTVDVFGSRWPGRKVSVEPDVG